MASLPVTLAIAGSDSGGGAGIQADLKVMSALGAFATSAVTAITAQNTVGVQAVSLLAPALVRAQIDSVATDMRVAAVKTGMLGSAEIVREVAAALDHHALRPLVVDPVMLAKSGDPLLADDAVSAVIELLVPRAALLTPNAPEAARLTGLRVENHDDAERAIAALAALGARAVLLKGGHLPARRDPDDGLFLVDLLWDGHEVIEIAAPWHPGGHTHGTGCSYAAAITALLARGFPLRSAVRIARRYLDGAIRRGLEIGAGAGPTDAFFFLDPGEMPWLRMHPGADG